MGLPIILGDHNVCTLLNFCLIECLKRKKISNYIVLQIDKHSSFECEGGNSSNIGGLKKRLINTVCMLLQGKNKLNTTRCSSYRTA